MSRRISTDSPPARPVLIAIAVAFTIILLVLAAVSILFSSEVQTRLFGTSGFP